MVNDHDNITKLLDDSDFFTRNLEALQSNHLFLQYCIEELKMIMPIQHRLGSINGVDHTMQYVPIKKVLAAFLEKDDVMTELLSDTKQSSPNHLHDFKDGQIFSQRPHDHPVIQVQFYTDEFEVVNPIGSKRSIHKMCAFYYTVGNLHPKFQCQLRHIFLAILVKHKLLKDVYGYSGVLKPLIDDLQDLH